MKNLIIQGPTSIRSISLGAHDFMARDSIYSLYIRTSIVFHSVLSFSFI